MEGIAEACRAFGTPVTGGNVSLYNESPSGVVDPTPTIGMVGLIDNERHITTQWFKNAGDAIILVGKIGEGLGGSQFLKVCHGRKQGPPPRVDLELEIRVQHAVRDLIREGLVKNAHDCSEGGLGITLAECCFNPEEILGADIDLDAGDTPATPVLFNESQSRIVISVAAYDVEKAMSILREREVPIQQLGKIGGDELRIRVNEESFRWPIASLHYAWFNAIRRAVENEAEKIPNL